MVSFDELDRLLAELAQRQEAIAIEIRSMRMIATQLSYSFSHSCRSDVYPGSPHLSDHFASLGFDDKPFIASIMPPPLLPAFAHPPRSRSGTLSPPVGRRTPSQTSYDDDPLGRSLRSRTRGHRRRYEPANESHYRHCRHSPADGAFYQPLFPFQRYDYRAREQRYDALDDLSYTPSLPYSRYDPRNIDYPPFRRDPYCAPFHHCRCERCRPSHRSDGNHALSHLDLALGGEGYESGWTQAAKRDYAIRVANRARAGDPEGIRLFNARPPWISHSAWDRFVASGALNSPRMTIHQLEKELKEDMRALAEVGGSGIICRDDWNSPYIFDYLPLPHIDSPPKKDSP